jgi:hypothetical protein
MPAGPAVLLASLFATLLLAPTSVGDPSDTTELRSPAPKLERGYLRVQGIERAPLVEALALRVPHLPLGAFESSTKIEPGASVAFIDVRREPVEPGSGQLSFMLTIVISDGRAFDRRIETGADDEEINRLVASTVANLLLAIEAGTVAADRGNVALPAPAASARPPCECPTPPGCPATTEVARPVEPVEPRGSATSSPRFELGPSVAAVAVLGLGTPTQADRFAAAGAQVGLHGRLPRGAVLGVELRAIGRGEGAGTSMARVRAALGGGYELRRGTWSLGASLWATVEPWWFRGAPIDPPPRPLFGLAARLTPALHQPRLAGGAMALAIGPVLELAASASLAGGRPSVELVVVREGGQERNRLRVGGLELSMGLAATLWFGLPR